MPASDPPGNQVERDPLASSAPPWLLFLQSPRSAFRPFRLMMASVGLFLLQGGCALLDGAFDSSGELSPLVKPPSLGPIASVTGFSLAAIWPIVGEAAWRLSEPVRMLAIPLLALVTPGQELSRYIHAVFVIVWVSAVWGLLGGAICRSLLLELSGKRAIRLRGPLSFAIRFAVPLIGAPLYPLMATLPLATVCAAFGGLLWLPMGIGRWLGQWLFLVPLVLGAGMAILLLGMLATWPLIHAAIAADAERGLDALSRCFSYVSRRMVQFAGLVILGFVVGVPGLLAMEWIAGFVMQLAVWGTGLAHRGPVVVPSFWEGVVGLVARSWSYAYLWTAATTLYLILRCDLDRTSLTDIAAAEPGVEASAAPGAR